MSFFKRKNDQLPTEPPPALTPGYCECAHDRCCHIDGKGKCKVAIHGVCAEWPTGTQCACQIYIFDPDNNDDDDDPEDQQTPGPLELERLYQA